MKTKLLLATVLALCSACSFNTYQLGKPLAWSDQAQPEDLSQALLLLGPPLRISELPDGFALAWEYWEIDETKLGVSLRPLGLDFLSIDWGDAKTRGEFLLLSFDKQGQLVDSSYESWRNDAGGGRGIQALVSVVDVVDIGDLTGHLPTHRWGSLSLEPPPVSLNRGSSMLQGTAGLQRRGTPSDIGQQTLETGRGD